MPRQTTLYRKPAVHTEGFCVHSIVAPPCSRLKHSLIFRSVSYTHLSVMREKDPLGRLIKLEKEYYSYYRQYFHLLHQIFSKAPMTQYYIEDDGEAWQYIKDYPFVTNEDDERNTMLYKQMCIRDRVLTDAGIQFHVDSLSPFALLSEQVTQSTTVTGTTTVNDTCLLYTSRCA